MPVEIKELHIRVAVSGKPPDAGKGPRQVDAKGAAHSDHDAGHDEIIAECVEQVLAILQAKRER